MNIPGIHDDDHDGGIVTGFPDGYRVKAQERITGCNLLALLSDSLESLPVEFNRIDTDMDQDFQSVITLEREGVTGRECSGD